MVTKECKTYPRFAKKDADVSKLFLTQAKKAIKKQIEFQALLKNNVGELAANSVVLKCDDARAVPCQNDSVNLVLTSPPYVTSYEYADLHQLALLWLEHPRTTMFFLAS